MKTLIPGFSSLLFVLLLCTGAAGAASGFIEIKCQPGAKVFLEGRFKGMTNADEGGLVLETAPGSRVVKVVRAGFQSVEKTIEVGADEVRQLKIEGFVKKIRIDQEGGGSRPGEEREFEIAPGVKMKFCRVPAGEFEMGDGKNPDCPKHKVELGEYWIGKSCVTNRQYARFVEATGHRAPDHADWREPVWRNGKCPQDKLDHPVVCVSWDDAAAFAKWAGLSLPSEAQWEKAARGPQGFVYPWGDEWDATKCRNGSNRSAGTTAPADAYPEGASGYGTVQQSGNVWEWCADWYDKNYYLESPSKDPKGPQRGSDRVIRGGGWILDDASFFRRACRDWHDPAFRDDYLGFRLVRNSP